MIEVHVSCGHGLCKEDNDWVKKCMPFEEEGAKPRSRRRKSCREIVQKLLICVYDDCHRAEMLSIRGKSLSFMTVVAHPPTYEQFLQLSVALGLHSAKPATVNHAAET